MDPTNDLGLHVFLYKPDTGAFDELTTEIGAGFGNFRNKYAWSASLFDGGDADEVPELYVTPLNSRSDFVGLITAGVTLDTLFSTGTLPLRDFVVFHDAYHYFEHRFGIEAAGAIAVSDAAPPSPARVAEIRAAIEGMDAACVFAEPQFEPDLVDTVTEGTGARTGVLDPVGVALEPGPALYPSLLRNLAKSLVGCLAD